jgi:hypothetical protein
LFIRGQKWRRIKYNRGRTEDEKRKSSVTIKDFSLKCGVSVATGIFRELKDPG